jgi:hypothetical protein
MNQQVESDLQKGLENMVESFDIRLIRGDRQRSLPPIKTPGQGVPRSESAVP